MCGGSPAGGNPDSSGRTACQMHRARVGWESLAEGLEVQFEEASRLGSWLPPWPSPQVASASAHISCFHSGPAQAS